MKGEEKEGRVDQAVHHALSNPTFPLAKMTWATTKLEVVRQFIMP